MTEPIPINDLTFGIELEVVTPSHTSAGDQWDGETRRIALAAALVTAGLNARNEQYNHATRSWWKITTDASIGHNNAEIVSPVLRGPDGFRQVRMACQAIEEFGCRVNRTTGFHVHVGVADRFGEQLGFFKELVRTYAKFEPIIDQLVSHSRRARNNAYCAPVVFTPEMATATTIRGLRQTYGSNRFRKLNLEAFAAHGTVEFRQHQGTTNASKIENWIRFCLRMVAHAAQNTERETTSTPPRHPIMPREPQFIDPFDLSTATPVHPEDFTRSRARAYSRSWVIGRIGRNPRTRGIGFNNWPNYRLGMTVREYLQAGHPWDQLRWDVVHYGAITIVNATTASPIPVTPGSDEFNRRAAVLLEWRELCATLQRDHEAALAQHASSFPPPPTRPPTDVAPNTLDGLLNLIGAPNDERAFFTERQLELNGG